MFPSLHNLCAAHQGRTVTINMENAVLVGVPNSTITKFDSFTAQRYTLPEPRDELLSSRASGLPMDAKMDWRFKASSDVTV